MKSLPFRRQAAFAALVFLSSIAFATAATVYVTADNGATNLFGTLDVATGQFTEIGTTDPLFYALTTGANGQLFGGDINSGHLFTISKSGATAQYGSSTAPDMFQGLAYSKSTGNFFAVNVGETTVTLHSITGNGNNNALIGEMVGANSPGLFPTGNLVFGPGGQLFFDYLAADSASAALYTVNTSTGGLTPVGSELGTDILNLFSDGKTLYGIDTDFTSNDAPLGIYTINTTTGVATQISTVSGLPGDYYLDTSTASVPDTAITFKLLLFSMCAIVVPRTLRRVV